MHARRQQALFPHCPLSRGGSSCRSGNHPPSVFSDTLRGSRTGRYIFPQLQVRPPSVQRAQAAGAPHPTTHTEASFISILSAQSPIAAHIPLPGQCPFLRRRGNFAAGYPRKSPLRPQRKHDCDWANEKRHRGSISRVSIFSTLPRSTPATAVVITIAAITAATTTTTRVTPPCDDDDEDEDEEGRRMNESLC